MSKVLHIHPALAGLDPEPSAAPIVPGSSVSPADIQRIMQQAIDERSAAIRHEARTFGIHSAIFASGLTFLGYVGAGPFGGIVGALAGLWSVSNKEPLPSLGAPSATGEWTFNGEPASLSELQRHGREAGRKIAVQWLLQERPDLEALDAMIATGVADLRTNASGEKTPYDEAIAGEVRAVFLRERDRIAPGLAAQSAAAEAQEVAARAAAEARRLAEKARDE